MKQSSIRSAQSAFASLCSLSGLVLSVACEQTEPSEAPDEVDTVSSAELSDSGVPRVHHMGWIRDTPDLVNAKRIPAPPPPTSPLPSRVDLRFAFPVGEQSHQASSVGWAVAGVKTIQEVAEWGWNAYYDNPTDRFSPSWVYNQVNGGSDNGATLSAALTLLVKGGIDSAELFPYDDEDFTRQPSDASRKRAARFKAASWGVLQRTETVLKQTLAAGNPVLAGFAVYPDFDDLSPTNQVYDTSAGSSRGDHVVILDGYDDDMKAFSFQNSWGSRWGNYGYGWLAYSFIQNAKLAMVPYVMTDAKDVPPTVTNSLYIISNGRLYRVDDEFGDWFPVSPPGAWTGTTSMAALNGSLYAIQNAQLFKVDPANTGTSAWKSLGTGHWSGPTQMTVLNGNLYVIQADALMRVDTSGNWTKVGTGNWTGATSMAALGGSLYVIQNSTLLRVDPSGDSWVDVGGGAVWGGPTRMAALGSDLFIVQGDQIRDFNGSNVVTVITAFCCVTSMTALNGALYVVDDANLYKVLPTGEFHQMRPSSNWPSNDAMTAIN